MNCECDDESAGFGLREFLFFFLFSFWDLEDGYIGGCGSDCIYRMRIKLGVGEMELVLLVSL